MEGRIYRIAPGMTLEYIQIPRPLSEVLKEGVGDKGFDVFYSEDSFVAPWSTPMEELLISPKDIFIRRRNTLHEAWYLSDCFLDRETWQQVQASVVMTQAEKQGHAFRGFRLSVDFAPAKEEVERLVGEDGFLQMTCDKFCKEKGFCALKSCDRRMASIFEDLYTVPEGILEPYLKLKCMEILLVLSQSLSEVVPPKMAPHRQKDIAAVYERIETGYTEQLSIDGLSREFCMAQTTLKQCFKMTYGTTIYQCIRQFRMKHAAQDLVSTDDKILTIANRVGYENGSKFAQAFEKTMGLRPSDYRKKYRAI